MSLNRFAKKVDSTQGEIVAALRKAGWYVYILSKPVDLLCWKASKGFRLLEIKSKRKKDGTTARRKAQVEQNEFIDITGCPVVVTPEEAIKALEWIGCEYVGCDRGYPHIHASGGPEKPL